MSQRKSGYKRKRRDRYETPAWVTDCVAGYIHGRRRIWEPACASGKMTRALRKHGFVVLGSDIASGRDFLKRRSMLPGYSAIVTNPPYELATEFIEHALALTKRVRGYVAMLLRTDFDHAKTRRHLFKDCPAFAGKIVLTQRIIWFEGTGGKPSFNHAWFIWDWRNTDEPTVGYAP